MCVSTIMFEKKSYMRRQQEMRGEIPVTYFYKIDKKFINQFILIWRFFEFECAVPVCIRIYTELGIMYGQYRYEDRNGREIAVDDLTKIFCRDTDSALTIIELVAYYMLQKYNRVMQFIYKINELFKFNRIGYVLIVDESNRDVNIMRIEDETFFIECTEQSLGILSVKKYIDARRHYMESYEKLAKSDYDSALLEMAKAIESVLKTRFSERSISFDSKKDTLSRLLNIAQAHIVGSVHNFEYFKQVIMDAGRARNPSGHGHAEGQAPQLDEKYVRFVINQGAANLLFLAEVDMS